MPFLIIQLKPTISQHNNKEPLGTEAVHTKPDGSDSKESASQAGDPGSIPGSRRSPGEGNGIPLHYSCLGNPMDRRDWQATVQGVAQRQA